MNIVIKVVLITTATTLLQCGPNKGPGSPHGACDFDEVKNKIAPSVVRILHAEGAGSGFVVEADDHRALIVTNYHVVQPGEAFVVEFYREGAAPMKVAGVEVVKVDAERDLAVLSVPIMNVALEPIAISDDERELQQRIYVAGFPGVEGSEAAQTFEEGRITALKREFKIGAGGMSISGGKTWFVQTNANINFGNSGGPVFDSCGRAVGVVAARHNAAERTGFFIAGELVPDLVKRAKQPPAKGESEVRAQVKRHLDSVKFKEGSEASRYVSRTLQLAFHAKARELYEDSLGRIRLLGLLEDPLFEQWPKEEQAKFVVGKLPSLHPVSLTATIIELARESSGITTYDAGRIFYSMFIENGAFDVASYDIERVRLADETHATAFVQVASRDSQTPRNYVYSLEREWGDWMITGYEEK
jgi:S1-C subfamily serine protease